MSYKKATLLYGIAFILQFSLLNLVSVFGVTPNLILCLLIFITYKYNDGMKSALIGIPFALLSDLVGGQYVGVSALALFLLCLAVSYFGRDLNRETLWTLLTVTAIGTVTYYFLSWVIMTILGNPSTFFGLLKFLFLALPLNMFVSVVAFLVFSRVYRPKIRPAGYEMVDRSMGIPKRNNKKILRNMR
jgi:rod shape-determining protein MreD